MTSRPAGSPPPEGAALRTVIVGASSGLGRCIGVGLAKRGRRVAMLARRADRLAQAAADAGNGALAVPCDATDASSCAAAVERIVDELGGIDALVYCPAVTPLQRLADVTSETWHEVFDTNVVGAALVTSAALPHLRASTGRAIYLTTVAATGRTPPWPGLAAYTATKAALDKLVECWTAEHPEIGFTRLAVGECAGGVGDAATSLADTWDPELVDELMPLWIERDYMTGALLDVEEIVEVVDMVLARGGTAQMPSLVLQAGPPPPAPDRRRG